MFPSSKTAQQRETFNRLTGAVVLSLLLHLGFYAAMDLGKKLDWAQHPAPAWLLKWLKPVNLVSATDSPAPWPIQPKRLREEIERSKKKPAIPDRFIDVDPTLAIIDPPADPKFYSTHTTRAAAPNPRQTKQDVPKVDGEQTLIPKIIAFATPIVAPFTARPDDQVPLGKTLTPVPPLESVIRPQMDPKLDFKPTTAINPSPTARAETSSATEAAIVPAQPNFANLRPPAPPAAPALNLPEAPNGNLLSHPPNENPTRTANVNSKPAQPLAGGSSGSSGGTPAAALPSPKPRTLLEAKASQAISGALAGKKMIQDGGVNRPGKLSFDVIGTPYGPYDALFFSAVQQRWWDLLENGRRNPAIPGEVRLSFLLHSDGKITDLRLGNSTVTEFQTQVCPATLLDVSPFLEWPKAMREAIGADERRVNFRFIYW